jgi:hypothetical protein
MKNKLTVTDFIMFLTGFMAINTAALFITMMAYFSIKLLPMIVPIADCAIADPLPFWPLFLIVGGCVWSAFICRTVFSGGKYGNQ